MLGADFAYDGGRRRSSIFGERRLTFEQRVQSTQRLYMPRNARVRRGHHAAYRLTLPASTLFLEPSWCRCIQTEAV